jgi:peptidoglycan/xylan/chitin deacetylase (PgdA/CDA1 family)
MAVRYATIALDYENLTHLFGTLGLPPGPETHVMYGPVAERFLEVFERHGVRATIFAIGQDARHPANGRMLRRFVEAGHEVANHTLTHPFGMRRLTRAAKLVEIDEAQRILEDATGQPIVGYKAPAHDIDRDVIDALEERGYLYDASVYPSFFNPLLNMVFRVVGNNRPLGLGDWQCMLAPNRPYVPAERYWRRGRRKLVEFPLTQIPGIRFPFYSTVMFTAGWASFQASWALVRWLPFVTYMFHSFDLLDTADAGVDPVLTRHPSLRHTLASRTAMVGRALSAIARTHRFVTYRDAVTVSHVRDAILG